MGLTLAVGILAEHDDEGAAHYREQFEILNRYLATIGLPPHQEPEQCEEFSGDMYGYSGVHYLRRFAAYLDLRRGLPTPGDDDASKSPVLTEYYAAFDRQSKPGALGRLFGVKPKPRRFDHLIIHSDAEGYYLPQDFPEVLLPGEAYPVAGGMVGSSPRLLEECAIIAGHLKLPLNLDGEDDRLYEAIDTQGQPGTEGWQRYGVESLTCLRLYQAAKHSVETGAAIVFG